MVASLSSVVWNHRLTMQAHASRGAQGLGGLSLTWRQLLMAGKRFIDAIEEKLALIVPTLNTIEFGGDQPYLCELQTLLRQHLAAWLPCSSEIPAWMPQQPICTRRRPLL